MADQEYDSAAASPPPTAHENGNGDAERSPVDRRGEDSMMDRERSPAYGRSDDRDTREERTRDRSPERRPPPPPPGRDVSLHGVRPLMALEAFKARKDH